MKHAVCAAAALAVGLALAVSAQAQGTNYATTPQTSTPQTSTPQTTAPAAPGNNMRANAPNTQANAPQSMQQNAQNGAQAAPRVHRMHRMSTRMPRRGQVRMIQARLRADGLYNGRIDGIYGPRTRVAVITFERRHRMPRTARMNRRVFNEITGGGTAGYGASGNGGNQTPAMMPAPRSQENGAGGYGGNLNRQ